MGKQNLVIKGIVIDKIPNQNKNHEKVYRVAGSSNAVTIPSEWQIILNMKDCPSLVEKALLKVRIPYTKIGSLELTYIEQHILVVAPEGFPFDLLEDKGV
jgi:hypothetical protein